MVVCLQGKPPQNHHKPPLKHRKYAGFGMIGIRKSIVLHQHGLATLNEPSWSHSLDKIVAFYQHTNNHHPKFWWWFAVVCGGLPASSLVSLPIPKFWWWFAVMCGGFGFFPVICGNLWWFVFYSHTDLRSSSSSSLLLQFLFCAGQLLRRIIAHWRSDLVQCEKSKYGIITQVLDQVPSF